VASQKKILKAPRKQKLRQKTSLAGVHLFLTQPSKQFILKILLFKNYVRHVYAPKRSLPPELLNPEAHPSPYEDPKKKKCTVFFLKSDNIVTSKLGNPIGGQQALNTGSTGGLIGGATSSNTGIVSHLYESSGDEFSETEDVENPNYSAF
jgi:hypothetical protein